jgi:site-specific DNA-methyltransferase (adenine-specific)
VIRYEVGDAAQVLARLNESSFSCCITSPPYYKLRNYLSDEHSDKQAEIGCEPTPQAYLNKLIAVFREVRRLLRDSGTLWLVIGDSYDDAGSLLGMPWRLALALRDDGWVLRQEIIWSKPDPMPQNMINRCTTSHESIFLFSKSMRYHFDAKAIAEDAVCGPGRTSDVERPRGHYKGKWSEPLRGSRQDGSFRAVRETRNRRSVWTVPTPNYAGAHYATFPPRVVELCILAGCPPGGRVLDPFGGSGTTALVADRLQRHAMLIDINEVFIEQARRRIEREAPLLSEEEAATL